MHIYTRAFLFVWRTNTVFTGQVPVETNSPSTNFWRQRRITSNEITLAADANSRPILKISLHGSRAYNSLIATVIYRRYVCGYAYVNVLYTYTCMYSHVSCEHSVIYHTSLPQCKLITIRHVGAQVLRKYSK